MDVLVDERLDGFMCTITKTARARSGQAMGLLETFGKNLGLPHSKKIQSGLWELRVKGDQEIRLLYGFVGGAACVVHGLVKKSNKTPKKEIDTVLKRLLHLK